MLLHITVGCSHNECTFCGTYRGKKFKIKSLDKIKDDLDEASSYGYVEKVFLCDGDALIIPQKRLEEMLKLVNYKLSTVRRIGTYYRAFRLTGELYHAKQTKTIFLAKS